MDYSDYLHLDEVLGAQHPLSPDHNELLFIVQHQTTELWMKLMLHELRAAIAAVETTELDRAFKMLSRVSRIMEQLVHAWDVLATMTPTEYSAIRPFLSSSSGFQSWQYRSVEFLVGNKHAAMLAQHDGRPAALAIVADDLRSPSLYDEALRLMARRGLDLPADHLTRDWTQPYVADAAVEDAWFTVYRRPRDALGPLPVGRGAGRLRGRVPPVALPPRDDRRTDHRRQARHRRYRRRQLPAPDARRRAVPRAVVGARAPLTSMSTSAATPGRRRWSAGCRRPTCNAGRMPNYRVRLAGPAAITLRLATTLADADGVDLTSSEQPVALADGTVALNVVVEGTFDDVSDAVAGIRGDLPSDASIDLTGA